MELTNRGAREMGTENANVFSCDIGVRRFFEGGRDLIVELSQRGMEKTSGGATATPFDETSGKIRVRRASSRSTCNRQPRCTHLTQFRFL